VRTFNGQPVAPFFRLLVQLAFNLVLLVAACPLLKRVVTGKPIVVVVVLVVAAVAVVVAAPLVETVLEEFQIVAKLVGKLKQEPAQVVFVVHLLLTQVLVKLNFKLDHHL